MAAAYWVRWPDKLSKTVVNVLLSFPVFWLALLLILLFAEALVPGPGRLLFRHIIPNILPNTVVLFTPRVGRCVLSIAALRDQLDLRGREVKDL